MRRTCRARERSTVYRGSMSSASDRVLRFEQSAFTLYKEPVWTLINAATEFKESFQPQGASAKDGEVDKQINEALSRKAYFRNVYEDVLSYTTSWHPGQGSQIMSRSWSRTGSQCSRASVETTASELERRENFNAHKIAHHCVVGPYAELAKTVFLDQADKEEKNAQQEHIHEINGHINREESEHVQRD